MLLLMTLGFQEPAGRRPSALMPGHTGVEARISAAVTMLMNRLWIIHEGGRCVGRCSSDCCRLAVYSGPFRQHQMNVLEIIAILRCLSGCVRPFV